MYRLVSFSDGAALVTNDAQPYSAAFKADDAEHAERIVLDLNQPVMLAELAALRFVFETDGLTLDSGLQIQTDRESRDELYSNFTNLKYGLIPDTDWKAANGWKAVTLAEIEPIVRAVAAHVRGCYRAERRVEVAITGAVTMVDIDAIDIPAMFAAAYQVAFDEVMSSEPVTA